MTKAIESQHEAIREEYRKQSIAWGRAPIDVHLQWVVAQLDLDPTLHVLDIAAGSGLFSRAVAPHVASVVATDLTPEMLEQGRARAQEAQLNNITFQQAAAETLPLADASIDLVISRYAVHHFLSPVVVFKEAYRVVRPGGRAAFVDMVADENGAIRGTQNRLERIVDETHTEVLAPTRLTGELVSTGFILEKFLSREVPVLFERWQSFLPQDAPSRVAVRRALEEELAGGPPTGLRPFNREGQLYFTHTWGLAIGRKAA
jgi:SAM-dependent methyltransferase